MGIQSYFIEKRLQQSLKSDLKKIDSNEIVSIKNVALITDCNSNLSKAHFSLLFKHTGWINENIYGLSIIENGQQLPFFTESTISKKDVKFFGRINSESFQKFIARSYDLMIDFTSVKTTLSSLIISKLKAPLKVGPEAINPYFYNIILKTDPNNKEEFIHELVKYLKILKLL